LIGGVLALAKEDRITKKKEKPTREGRPFSALRREDRLTKVNILNQMPLYRGLAVRGKKKGKECTERLLLEGYEGRGEHGHTFLVAEWGDVGGWYLRLSSLENRKPRPFPYLRRGEFRVGKGAGRGKPGGLFWFWSPPRPTSMSEGGCKKGRGGDSHCPAREHGFFVIGGHEGPTKPSDLFFILFGVLKNGLQNDSGRDYNRE